MPNPGAELASLDFANLIGGPLNAVITAQSNAAMATANFIKTVGFDENNEPIYVDFKYPKEVSPYKPVVNPKLVSAKCPTVAPNTFQPNEVLNIVFKTSTPSDTFVEATGTITADVAGGIAANTFVSIINSGDFKDSTTIASSVKGNIVGASITPTTQPAFILSFSTLIAATPAVFQEMKFSVPILTMLPIPFIKVDQITIDFNAKINSTETQTSSSEFSASGALEASYGGKRANVKFSGTVAYKRTNSSGSSIERTYSMGIHVQASQDEMPAGMEKLLNILEGAMISTPGQITQRK